MASPVGDAHLARMHAQSVRSTADAARQAKDSLSGQLGALGWQGNRADRFRARSDELFQNLQTAADGLAQASVALSRYADWVDEREAHLRRLERRVRAWADLHPAGAVVNAEPDASAIGYFPPPLDTEWEVLAARLQRLGASF